MKLSLLEGALKGTLESPLKGALEDDFESTLALSERPFFIAP